MMNENKCSMCSGDLPIPEYDGDDPPKVKGKPVCYECWGIEHTNKTPFIINYKITSYVQGQEDVMSTKEIRLDELPTFIDQLFRKPGYWVDFVLIENGCV
jgi:hypothetical protein